MIMADRTSNTTFFVSTNPDRIAFRSNASDGDTFDIPYGAGTAVLGMNAEDDNDAIPSATVSGKTVTLGLIDDAGSAVSTDTDIVGEVLLQSQ